MNYYFAAFKKYAKFSGRTRRSEYWYFVLFNFFAIIILMILSFGIKFPTLIVIYYLAMILPALSVGVRRMHDVDKSGWYILIPIYNLILYCTDGTVGDNEYGPDPKGRVGFGAADYQKPFDTIN